MRNIWGKLNRRGNLPYIDDLNMLLLGIIIGMALYA